MASTTEKLLSIKQKVFFKNFIKYTFMKLKLLNYLAPVSFLIVRFRLTYAVI